MKVRSLLLALIILFELTSIQAQDANEVLQLELGASNLGWLITSIRTPSGDWDLFAMRPDGSQLRNLTRTPDASEFYPRLIDAARFGDRDSLGELLTTYRKYIVFLARTQLQRHMQAKADPSDIAQEVFMAAHGNIADFRGQASHSPIW